MFVMTVIVCVAIVIMMSVWASGEHSKWVDRVESRLKAIEERLDLLDGSAAWLVKCDQFDKCPKSNGCPHAKPHNVGPRCREICVLEGKNCVPRCRPVKWR